MNKEIQENLENMIEREKARKESKNKPPIKIRGNFDDTTDRIIFYWLITCIWLISRIFLLITSALLRSSLLPSGPAGFRYLIFQI